MMSASLPALNQTEIPLPQLDRARLFPDGRVA